MDLKKEIMGGLYRMMPRTYNFNEKHRYMLTKRVKTLLRRRNIWFRMIRLFVLKEGGSAC